MCWALYLASDKELPQVPWDKENPSFNTQELSDIEQPVRKQFSLQHVIYLGSHEGCGCGFMSADNEGIQQNETLKDLSSYLSCALHTGSSLEIFLCWEGDQSKPPSVRKYVAVSEFSGADFPLAEKEFAIVTT